MLAAVCNIPGTQDEAARLMDEILTPIPIDLRDLKRKRAEQLPICLKSVELLTKPATRVIFINQP